MSETSKKVSDAIKPILVETLSKQAYAALLAIPGFGWVFGLPVIGYMTRFFIERIVGWAVQESAVGLSLLWIQVDLSYEVGSAEEAAKKLKAMLEEPAKYSVKEQEKIDEYFDDTTIDLIQLGIKRL